MLYPREHAQAFGVEIETPKVQASRGGGSGAGASFRGRGWGSTDPPRISDTNFSL